MGLKLKRCVDVEWWEVDVHNQRFALGTRRVKNRSDEESLLVVDERRGTMPGNTRPEKELPVSSIH